MGHSNKEVNTGKRILESSALTDQGRRWLLGQLDPFHDSPFQPAGYPDGRNSASVVQTVRLSTVVSTPSGLGGGNWDCHVHNLPDFASVPGNNVLSSGYFNWNTGNMGGSNGNVYPDAGVSILTGAAGSQMLPSNSSSTYATGTQTQVLNPGSYVSGKSRLIGMGLEVINTTAEIYRQGLVTAYRQPQLTESYTSVNVVSNTSTMNVNSMTPFRMFEMAPQTAQQALLLAGSKQWPASRGYYGVPPLNRLQNPVMGVDTLGRVHVAQSVESNVSTVVYPGALISYFLVSTVSSNQFTSKYFAPYDTVGAYFTGLSAQTTLQVNVIWYIETFPGVNSSFVTLAQQPSPYDPRAIELYSEIAQHLPVGVPQDENPDGEYWGNILGTIGSMVSVAGAIDPIFGLIGKGINLASTAVPKVINLFNDDTKVKKQTKKAIEGAKALQSLKSAPSKPKVKSKSKVKSKTNK